MTRGGRGVEKLEFWGDVIYGWSLTGNSKLNFFWILSIAKQRYNHFDLINRKNLSELLENILSYFTL